MVKLGLIGTGFIGHTHTAAYEVLVKELDFKVTAVADLDEEKARKIAELFGAEVYSSGEELIQNADINTVDICLPTYLHAPHAISAMRKGYNVLVEKPVCVSEEQAVELLKVQRETGVNVMVGHCIRFWDEYVYLKKLIDSQTFGKVVRGAFTRVSAKPTWSWQNWLHDSSKSGAAVLDLHIHDTDFVNYIFGEPRSIKAEITYSNVNAEHIFATYKYDDKIVNIEGGWDFPSVFPFNMAYRVNFEKAVVEYSIQNKPTVKVFTESGDAYNPDIVSECVSDSGVSGGNISSLGAYYNEIKYFLETINSGEKINRATLEDAVSSFRLVMKEIKSAKD